MPTPDDAREQLGDVPPDEMRAHLHRMADWVADYRETIADRAISPTVEPGEITSRLSAKPPRTGESLDSILGDLDALVMPGILHWGHPAFLGYFGSTSNGPALLGEIAAAALNVSAMTWRTSPAATEMETVMLSWIRQMVGLPQAFTGIVYDTASVAVVHALAAARELALSTNRSVRADGLLGGGTPPVLRAYASDQAHSSLEKAMILLGLGEQNAVRVPSDLDFRIETRALRDAIVADVRLGFVPMAVVATVGTTSTASVDPVSEIAELCAEYRTWLHVDAAYGGALAVLPEGRWVMAGVERADSVVINPHKWLFVPLDFSALYVRRPDVVRGVFSLTPEYLRGDAGHAIDYMDYGIQLGRRFRALKAWMVLRTFGSDGIAARIREHCRLAKLLTGWIEASSHFTRMAPQQMAVVCFRYEPRSLDVADCDALNEAIVDAVVRSGEAYVTHTRLRGRTAIRVGIGNVLTTEHHVAQVWAVIRREAERLHPASTPPKTP